MDTSIYLYIYMHACLESNILEYVTLYAKRGHFAQIMNIELLVSADSTGCALSVLQATSRSHLPFTRYKQKYTLIEILCFRDTHDFMSNSSVSIALMLLFVFDEDAGAQLRTYCASASS